MTQNFSANNPPPDDGLFLVLKILLLIAAVIVIFLLARVVFGAEAVLAPLPPRLAARGCRAHGQLFQAGPSGHSSAHHVHVDQWDAPLSTDSPGSEVTQ
jgi:hypothetical protein